ncbi:DNA-processing protein DprA [Uliginosibacterium sp. TH139]|uniref:DNA-processing protein DprA n=1 Tax=Uliginosibacterium sp. TH139 TaxID=2067453 RepID=UPI000C7AEA7F|nr:DNA-processing protein DprA [Uliginosibacterium sp. TH139]PLK50283.1 DNA-protecting protein DprA [Uliginosibacterium sp. TH139]
MSASDLRYWLRLCLIPGIGPERQRELLATFGLPERIFAAGQFSLAQVIGEKLATALRTHDNSALVETALVWANEPGNAILTLGDATYPQALLQIADPPSLLYAKGRVELLQQPAIAMVGARAATPQGEANAEAFAEAFAAANLTVISGLALGVDAAAHRGALKAAGSTIAVIGTGADRIYPARNAALARRIAENGLVISEFPLGTPPTPYNFPRRNRIISGLARGVLVVEAAVDSGSLITARTAIEQGRDVFAIPGSIHSPQARGCHRLIKQGAKLVESAQDVLEELDWAHNAHIAPVVSQASADAEELGLLGQMGFDPVDPDTLGTRAGLTPDALFAILTTLELDGRIARLAGGRFQRIT